MISGENVEYTTIVFDRRDGGGQNTWFFFFSSYILLAWGLYVSLFSNDDLIFFTAADLLSSFKNTILA